MDIIKIENGYLAANAYIVYKGKTAVVIDCGTDFDKVYSVIEEKGLNPVALLLTHSHFDHVLTAKEFQKRGVKVYISKEDGEKLEKGDTLSGDFGIENVSNAMEPFYTTRPDGERSGIGFTVMKTFMDKVSVDSTVGIGTKVYMVKRLKTGS